MAVGAPTGLANGFSGSDLSAYTTASQSPSANRIILAFIMSSVAGSVKADTPTSLSGNGLTWVRLEDFYSTTNTVNKVMNSAWAALTGSSPSAGAVTINFPAAQNLCAWSFAEFSGTYLTSLEDAIRQVRFGDSPTNHRTTEVGFLAGQSSDNAIWTGMSKQGSETVSPGTGMTEIHEVAITGVLETLQTQYRLGTQRQVDATWTTANKEGGMIGVELRAATQPIDWRYGDLRERVDKSLTYRTGVINVSTSGDTDILTVTNDKQAHIYGIVLYAEGTVTILLENPTKDYAPVVLHAGEGYRQWVDPPGYLFLPVKSGVGSTFGVSLDAAVAVKGWFAYWEDDA